jgi:heptosyltransferase-2
MKKVLIIQTAFIGDVILTTPLIQSLHVAFPQASIDFLTIPKSLNILENNPYLAEIIIFDKTGRDKGLSGIIRLANLLTKKKYDLCIVPHRSLRSAFLAWRTGAPIRIGFDRSALKSAFSHIITYQYDKHEIERNLSLLEPLNIPTQLVAPSVYPTPEDRLFVNRFFSDFHLQGSDKPLAVAPGSVWPTKRWPAGYFSSFCQTLDNEGVCTILIGSSEDAGLCQKVISGLNRSYSLAGKLTLRQTYALLTRCSGVLTNDSAPLHLGMAAGIPIFSIFGPTVPAFGFAPFGQNAFIIENKSMTCRPCTVHGGKICPIKTFECMESLKPQTVVNLVLSKISQ